MTDKGITKIYLDKSLKELRFGVTKELKGHIDQEVKSLRTHIDTQFDDIDTQFDDIDKQFDDLNARTARGFRDIQERLDVREEVEKLKRDNKMIKEALHLPA